MPVVVILLQLIGVNLLHADQLQTAYWAAGTISQPVELGAGVTVFELNPFLAGHPERVRPYFSLLKLLVIAAPFFLPRDRALLFLTGIAVAEGLAVLHNARILDGAGMAWSLAWLYGGG